MKITQLFSIVGVILALASSTNAAAQAEATCSGSGGTNCRGTIPDGPISTPFTSSFTAPNVTCSGVPLSLGVRVNVVHDNVGDLTISVAGPNGNAVLMDQPAGAFSGGCAGDDVNATFVGTGGGGANFCVEGGLPAVAGVLNAVSGGGALSAGNSSSGAWTLTVTDNSNGFEGFVEDWAVVAVCNSAPVPIQGSSTLIVLLLALGMMGCGVLGRKWTSSPRA
jgi:subtilisin-like proprotein convertase family protein